jgi:hypothetical protein
LRQVRHRFQMGRALEGPLARPLPISHRLLSKARLGVVLGKEFRLHVAGLRESCLQHVGNPLMILLPRIPQQRLIGHVLDEGMLEGVGGLWRQSLLVQELCLHQLLQATP